MRLPKVLAGLRCILYLGLLGLAATAFGQANGELQIHYIVFC